MTLLFTEYLNPRETVRQKAYEETARTGPRPLITRMRPKEVA